MPPTQSSISSSLETLSTSSLSTDPDDIFSSTDNTFSTSSSDDFLYNSTYSLINGTAGVVATTTNYTSIKHDSENEISVGGLDDIGMISSAEVIDNMEFYRPSHLVLSPKQHVASLHTNLTTIVKDGGVGVGVGESPNSNFMFLLEDLGEYFYNYNSTSNGDSGIGGNYFNGITSTVLPNATDYFHNCTNITCIDSIAGLYFFFDEIFLHERTFSVKELVSCYAIVVLSN